MTRAVFTATWDDVPHLTALQKSELLASIPPYQRDARSKGIPQLGSGAIYPVSEEDLIEDPFEIPPYWRRGYALDVGWNRTAAIWGAHDLDADCLHLYAEYYVGQAEPAVHAAAIKAKGGWMQGVVDPASRGRSQVDGERLFDVYRDLGLLLTPADNAVEAGLFEVWQMMSTGRLKVARTLQNWLSEFRLYRRDERGKIVKERDHLMDASRYLVMAGLSCFTIPPNAADRLRAQQGRGNQAADEYDRYA